MSLARFFLALNGSFMLAVAGCLLLWQIRGMED